METRDRVVVTFWLPDGASPDRAIMHAYGPYTLSEARAVKREFDSDDRPGKGLSYAKVCKPIDVDAMNASLNQKEESA